MKYIALLLLVLVSSAHAVFSNADKAQLGFVNYAPNPGAEFGKTGYTASAGTFATTTTAANLARGAVGFSWDGSATGQTVTSTQVTIPAGLYGANCLAKVTYKTAESTVPYVLEAIDGSSNVLGSVTLSAASTFTDAYAPFICPSSSTFALRVRTSSSAGDPAIIYFDEVWLGKNYQLGTVSQAKHFGGSTWAATSNCDWTSTSGSFANYGADSDCTTPAGSNLQGSAIAPSTKVPSIRFSSMPPGRYLIIATGEFSRNNVTETTQWRFSDGTNATYEMPLNFGTTTSIGIGTITGWLTYTTAQSDTTIQIQTRTGGSAQSEIDARNIALDIQVYYFPTSAQQAVSVDQAGWRIDANISGANISLGTSNQTSYVTPNDSGLTLTQNTGSATAWVSCSSTNDATGTTCSAGSEEPGISFTIPYAGAYLACVSFAHQVVNAASGVVDATFEIAETSNTAQTITQEGNSRVSSRHGVASTTETFPHRLCGTFNFTSVGRKTLRLMYEQAITATVTTNSILADAGANNGQRDIHWEVYPVSRAWPLPIVVGGVSSNTSSQERVERAELNCDASSSITSQSGTWLSAIGNRSTAACAITIAAGIFSATPVCTFTTKATSVQATAVNMTSATAGTVYGASADYDGYLICMGPK